MFHRHEILWRQFLWNVREGRKRTTATKKTKTTDMYNYKFLKYGSTLYEFFSHLLVLKFIPLLVLSLKIKMNYHKKPLFLLVSFLWMYFPNIRETNEHSRCYLWGSINFLKNLLKFIVSNYLRIRILKSPVTHCKVL